MIGYLAYTAADVSLVGWFSFGQCVLTVFTAGRFARVDYTPTPQVIGGLTFSQRLVLWMIYERHYASPETVAEAAAAGDVPGRAAGEAFVQMGPVGGPQDASLFTTGVFFHPAARGAVAGTLLMARMVEHMTDLRGEYEDVVLVLAEAMPEVRSARAQAHARRVKKGGRGGGGCWSLLHRGVVMPPGDGSTHSPSALTRHAFTPLPLPPRPGL